jgi:hypothetical protein
MVEVKLLAPRAALAAAVLAVALVGGLALVRWNVPTVVDGYPIGEAAGCADRCALFSAEASRWLDMDVPSHATIERIELFVPDYRDPRGDRIIVNGSGGTQYVAVMHLADGTVRAIEVGCGVGIDPG